MKPNALIPFAVGGLLSVALVTAAQANNVQETYLGKLEFQDQTITKKTAEFLHRQILLQRATQLVGWAMPMMNFYQLYPALLSNLKVSEDEIFFGLYDGYDGVYPYMTANVTTPYTIAMTDLSKTGPVVVDIPAGADLRRGRQCLDAAHQGNLRQTGKLLLVGPGQDYPKDFKGEIIQSDTFLVLYFYRALGTGAEAEKLRTAVQAYKLSDAANPPKTKFIKYEPKPGDKIALNTQPRDMRFWELVNAYVQKEPDGRPRPFFLRLAQRSGHRKGQTLQADR